MPRPQPKPEFYLNQLDPQTLASFDDQQLTVLHHLLEQAIPKPSPKWVDLRFTVDVILSRFYVVLMVGEDHRKQRRSYPVSQLTKIGNTIAAICLLIGLNLLLSLFILLTLYLLKSALGIDILPNHFLHNFE